MGKVDITLRPILKRYPKVKPLVAAILAEAAKQGATLSEFESACDIAQKMILSEMATSSMVISEYASSAQATLDGI